MATMEYQKGQEPCEFCYKFCCWYKYWLVICAAMTVARQSFIWSTWLALNDRRKLRRRASDSKKVYSYLLTYLQCLLFHVDQYTAE